MEYTDGTEIDRYPGVVLNDAFPTPGKVLEKDIFLQGSCAEAENLPSAHHAKQLSSAQTISPRGVLDKPLHSLSTMTMDEGRVRSAFYEHEDHLQSGRIQSFSMEQDDHSSDEDNNSEDESCLRRSARNHGTDRLHTSPREKRKVGRPIIYSGDPDAPDLTPQERRRIRRRIANRESARRVRAKRQDLIEEMSIKAQDMQELNAKLLARAQSVEHKHNLMMEQMTQINECLKQKTAENERLQSELNMLKNSIKEKSEGGSGKSSLTNSNICVPVFSGPQQPAMPSTTVTSGAIGVLQSHVPQQQQPSASGFQYSAFSAAAQAPQMDALEMQLASMQGMPGYGSPLQLWPSGKDTVVPAQQTSSTSTSLAMLSKPPQMQLDPPRLLSKELSLGGMVGGLSMDRSLSEFLHEVTCL